MRQISAAYSQSERSGSASCKVKMFSYSFRPSSLHTHAHTQHDRRTMGCGSHTITMHAAKAHRSSIASTSTAYASSHVRRPSSACTTERSVLTLRRRRGLLQQLEPPPRRAEPVGAAVEGVDRADNERRAQDQQGEPYGALRPCLAF